MALTERFTGTKVGVSDDGGTTYAYFLGIVSEDAITLPTHSKSVIPTRSQQDGDLHSQIAATPSTTDLVIVVFDHHDDITKLRTDPLVTAAEIEVQENCAANEFDFIILDTCLPGQTGLVVATKFKGQYIGFSPVKDSEQARKITITISVNNSYEHGTYTIV